LDFLNVKENINFQKILLSKKQLHDRLCSILQIIIKMSCQAETYQNTNNYEFSSFFRHLKIPECLCFVKIVMYHTK